LLTFRADDVDADRYGYENSEIVLMMDKGDAGHIPPTQANIVDNASDTLPYHDQV
jgi:hypothetical protein